MALIKFIERNEPPIKVNLWKTKGPRVHTAWLQSWNDASNILMHMVLNFTTITIDHCRGLKLWRRGMGTFCAILALCRSSSGYPSQKTSKVELWWFPSCHSEQIVEQRVETPRRSCDVSVWAKLTWHQYQWNRDTLTGWPGSYGSNWDDVLIKPVDGSITSEPLFKYFSGEC